MNQTIHFILVSAFLATVAASIGVGNVWAQERGAPVADRAGAQATDTQVAKCVPFERMKRLYPEGPLIPKHCSWPLTLRRLIICLKIDTTGAVTSVVIDSPNKIDPAFLDCLKSEAATWRYTPVCNSQGQPGATEWIVTVWPEI
jgi:hypothetical protein